MHTDVTLAGVDLCPEGTRWSVQVLLSHCKELGQGACLEIEGNGLLTEGKALPRMGWAVS